MKISYKIGYDNPSPSVKAFEETLCFPDGFSHISVPAAIGKGTLTALEINRDFHVNFQFYQLNVPLEVTKSSTDDSADWIHIIFYKLKLPETVYFYGNKFSYGQEGIFVHSVPIDALLKIPAFTERNVVFVRIARRQLELMLGTCHKEFLNQLLLPGQSFLIQEQLTDEMRGLLDELRHPPAAQALERLFYHVHTLRLIYGLLQQLNQRTGAPGGNNDPEHLAGVFKARDLLLRDLSAPPTIAELARNTLMSESLLKQSFREVFGVSIYQYFQNNRLEKARQLLAEKNRTVKEVGYELGFTNIGHFSRLFERAYHIKPKRFQLELSPDPTVFLPT